VEKQARVLVKVIQRLLKDKVKSRFVQEKEKKKMD
jgi:phosphoserine aminotransferase